MEMMTDCAQDRDPGLRVSGCTAVIDSGQWQGRDIAVIYYKRGNAYARIGELRRAIEDYDQAVRLDPSYATVYGNRGLTYSTLGEHRRAIQDFDQVLRLNPDSVLAYKNRGLAFSDIGEHRRAIQDFDQVLRLDPGNAFAYHSRGFAFGDLGEHRLSKFIKTSLMNLDRRAWIIWWRHMR